MNTSTRSDLIAALRQAHLDGLAYWNAFPLEEFFARIGEAWSPAENVRHLSKSIRPLAKALRTPRLVLRFMFGRPHHASVSYDALKERYQGMLAEGAKAGRFSPSDQNEPDREAWRKRIMSEHQIAHEQLIAAIERWNEKQLDRYQLPHPLLGKLTVREMLMFTLYHNGHHVAVVRKRKADAA